MFLKVRNGRSESALYGVCSDEDLIACYRETQDTEMIAELFHRHMHLVYGICLGYLHHADISKDGVMEIFEGLFEKLRRHEVIRFKPWLYKVSKNYCLMEIRKRTSDERMKRKYRIDMLTGYVYRFSGKTHVRYEEDSPEGTSFCSDSGDNGWGRMKRLQQALGRLGPEQHTCIRLLYLENKSYNEISRMTGFTVKQVKSHVQNGRRNLRNNRFLNS